MIQIVSEVENTLSYPGYQ